MSDSAATLTQDRQKLEMAALSAPAVIFTVAMIAFPVVYTILARLPDVFLDRQAVLCRACQLFQADLRLRILARAVDHHSPLRAVASAATRLRRLAGVGAVPRQAATGHRALVVHFAVHDAAGGRRHDVAGNPRSLAGCRQLCPVVVRPAPAGLAGLAVPGHSDGGADRQLAVDALCRSDRAGRAAIPAAECLRGCPDRWRIPIQDISAYHAAAAAADHCHCRDPAQRRSPALL